MKSDEISFEKDDEFLIGLVCNSNNSNASVDISKIEICVGGGDVVDNWNSGLAPDETPTPTIDIDCNINSYTNSN